MEEEGLEKLGTKEDFHGIYTDLLQLTAFHLTCFIVAG
jgi:hypothetical protein